jgi:hypothetical protein
VSGLAALTGEPPARAKVDFQAGAYDVYTYKPEMEKKYRNQFKMLENSDVPAEEKVLMIHDLYAEIGNGAEQVINFRTIDDLSSAEPAFFTDRNL